MLARRIGRNVRLIVGCLSFTRGTAALVPGDPIDYWLQWDRRAIKYNWSLDEAGHYTFYNFGLWREKCGPITYSRLLTFRAILR